VPTNADRFWRQSEQLFARWQRRLDTDPESVRREIALYLRWLNRIQPSTADAGLIREVLTEMALELLIEAVLRR
jgi:hypothetical protein